MSHELNPYLEKSVAFDEKLLEVPVKESGERMISVFVEVARVGANLQLSEGTNRIYHFRKPVAKRFAEAVGYLSMQDYRTFFSVE